MNRKKYIRQGCFRTIEWFWLKRADLEFKKPNDALLKVRYGFIPLSWDTNVRTIKTESPVRLHVNTFSLLFARVMVKVKDSSNVEYDIKGY